MIGTLGNIQTAEEAIDTPTMYVCGGRNSYHNCWGMNDLPGPPVHRLTIIPPLVTRRWWLKIVARTVAPVVHSVDVILGLLVALSDA